MESVFIFSITSLYKLQYIYIYHHKPGSLNISLYKPHCTASSLIHKLPYTEMLSSYVFLYKSRHMASINYEPILIGHGAEI